MELACPQCGETNREDSVDFPFCTHCHESLVKCGYCANFDSTAGVCRDPKPRWRKVSSDDELDCPRYRSILLIPTDFRRRVISPAKWVLIVAATLFAVIMVGIGAVGISNQNGLASPSPLGVEVVAVSTPSTPTVDVPFKLEFEVSNPDMRSSGPIRLSIPAAFLDRFKRLSIDPSPSNPPELLPREGERDRRYWHYYDFPSVPPQGQRRIVFELVTQPGFAETGFPFQEDRLTYDLNGIITDEGVRALGVHVYNSGKKGSFTAHRIFKVKTTQ